MPLTGLGLYGGHRGSRWLRNRIKVLKQFVVPSLQAQTNKNFTLWISVRQEDRHDKQVKALKEYFDSIREFETVFTYSGLCFWDDKLSDKVARDRLVTNLHGTIGELMNHIGGVSHVLMTIQPSDDCYKNGVVQGLQGVFREMPELQAVGFLKGYMMNYLTGELAEYNPVTIPPFFTIKFPKEVFIDPLKHLEYTGPYKSHEYIADKLKFGTIQERSFIVGCHGENVSTVFSHPYKGESVSREVLKDFGLKDVPNLKIKVSLRKWLLRKLPHKVQRKLRYVFGERFWNRIYEFLRA